MFSLCCWCFRSKCGRAEDGAFQRSSRAALYRESSSTSAVHVFPEVAGGESGAQSPLLETAMTCSTFLSILDYLFYTLAVRPNHISARPGTHDDIAELNCILKKKHP